MRSLNNNVLFLRNILEDRQVPTLTSSSWNGKPYVYTSDIKFNTDL
jgi:hypothetical protein